MTLKILKWIGFAACIALVVSCFLPWTYYADINKTFTGFFSEQNMYGKPGKFLIFFAIISAALILVSKIWAKRAQILIAALLVGYAVKTYILFTSCYKGYCPEILPGIYLMLTCCILIFLASIFPDVKVKNKD